MNVFKFLSLATFVCLTSLTNEAIFFITNAQLPQQVNKNQCPPQNRLVKSNIPIILNTGSTNTPCYRIYISPTGKVDYVVGSNRNGKDSLKQKLTHRFFRDIKKAQPLSKLPTQPCMKSVSFGSSTFIRLGGEQSPDLSCPSDNPQVKALFQDVNEINRDLKIPD